MTALRPVGLSVLVARAFEELDRCDSIFDLPRRRFVLEPEHEVLVHGRAAGAPLGPAAGPHTQLAQNIVSAWLGGGRVMELKTVQVLDRIAVARPCIDARTVGYNVEWSQELTLDESRVEYVKASMLIDILAHGFRVAPAVLFDLSVGYDYAGITNERVVNFVKQMIDARSTIDALRDELPRQFRDFDFTTDIARSVTLSTFHGCPPQEIERIADFLMTELGLDVAIKLNPTLLGERAVDEILHDRLGYTDINVPKTAFGHDPDFEDIARIAQRAKDLGRSFAVKLTNTLVVENRRGILPGDVAYLSGPPLHVLAMHLVQRFRRAFGQDLDLSFSAGIDRINYPDAVSLGLKPVTVCTDLLKPGGYARLHAYASELTKRMNGMAMAEFATADIDDYIAQLERNSRYHRDVVERPPRKTGVPLEVFDCATCDLCIPACPNDANFRVPLALRKPHQIVTFEDLCNDCGNCEAFCPDLGAPNRIKVRVRAGSEGPAAVRAAIHDPAHVNFLNALELERGQSAGRGAQVVVLPKHVQSREHHLSPAPCALPPELENA
jgi:putative selenate reductase